MITYAIGRDVVAIPPIHEPDGEARRQIAALVCEIAERLDELETLKVGYTADLMRRLWALHGETAVGYRFVLQVLHGDTTHITESYSTRGTARGKTKQDMHWEEKQCLAKIAAHFPEVAKVLEGIRAQVGQHEDGASKADLLREV